jgi:phosphopantothenoylcysteine decarboxylase/phosphopantothenate--cysteine ligase
MLQGKKILIGITGSIAAYKIIALVRLLVKANAEVRIVMTKNSADFVSPLVLSTLSKNNVLIHLANENEWSNHVMLGRWANIFLIAPLSCNTLAKMAYGLCDNLLMATYLSATCPVVVAPAMDEDMWHHPSTKNNLNTIRSYGNHVIDVTIGELGSGLIGEGRMAEPETIFNYLVEQIGRGNSLKNKKILITAGPTYEAIDPVRFLGNRSSGKMGYALAEAMYLQGADVTLVSGPSSEQIQFAGIQLIHVQTAQEMFDISLKLFKKTDIAIMSAAVADYTPVEVANQKIKKKTNQLTLALTKTKDILATLGSIKKKHQYLVGFALETDHEMNNALIKLKAKNADCIVLNSLNDKSTGFGFNTNKITILNKDETVQQFQLKSKKAVAADIVSFIITQLYK